MTILKNFITKKGKDTVIEAITGISGKIYTVTNGISMGRYCKYEEYQVMAGMGVTPKKLFESMKKTHDYFNSNKIADGILNNANNMVSVARVADHEYNPLLMLCTMFINYEGEDVKEWNEEDAIKKLEDWKDYNAADFFLFAKTLEPSCTDDFGEIFLNTMANQTTESKKKNTLKNE